MGNKWSPGCGCCDCEEAPSRTTCQYRSGANGQNVATRPTVTVSVSITGLGSPDCGTCDFEEEYVYTCGTVLTDTVFSCTFTGTTPVTSTTHGATRRIRVTINPTGSPAGTTGFVVVIDETIIYDFPLPPGENISSYGDRGVTRFFTWDNFAYTDCDGIPRTDINGALSFTGGSTVEQDGFFLSGENICEISATITAVNN